MSEQTNMAGGEGRLEQLEEYKQAMIAYAKSIQGGNYPGDDYYLQECWDEHYSEGIPPEAAVTEDMSYWEPES